MKRLQQLLRLTVPALALTLGLGGTAEAAFVVTNNNSAPASWAAAMAATPNTLNLPGVWSAAPTTVVPLPANLGGVYRSPFDNESLPGSPDNSAYIGNSYWAVGPSNPSNPAIMTFAGDQNSLSFLWGSVDSYNGVEFFNNNVSVGVVVNTDISPAPGNPTGKGASYVTISGMAFDEIRFSSSSNALEFSNLSTTPVPIPGAVWLFGSGLLGLMGIGFTRRRSANA